MASPVVYFVRRGHLPISRFLLFAIVTLWGCGSQAPAAVSSQQQSPERLSQLQLLARSPGVAIRLPAKGGDAAALPPPPAHGGRRGPARQVPPCRTGGWSRSGIGIPLCNDRQA